MTETSIHHPLSQTKENPTFWRLDPSDLCGLQKGKRTAHSHWSFTNSQSLSMDLTQYCFIMNVYYITEGIKTLLQKLVIQLYLPLVHFTQNFHN